MKRFKDFTPNQQIAIIGLLIAILPVGIAGLSLYYSLNNFNVNYQLSLNQSVMQNQIVDLTRNQTELQNRLYEITKEDMTFNQVINKIKLIQDNLEYMEKNCKEEINITITRNNQKVMKEAVATMIKTNNSSNASEILKNFTPTICYNQVSSEVTKEKKYYTDNVKLYVWAIITLIIIIFLVILYLVLWKYNSEVKPKRYILNENK